MTMKAGKLFLIAMTLILVLAACVQQEAQTQPTQVSSEAATTLQTEATTVPETTAEPTLPPPEANPYGPNDFVYDNGYMTCLSGPSILGIDVSVYQQDINWQKVADAGVEFVMIRVGYRGYRTGEITPDKNAQKNYEGAKAAGLKIGVYLFSQAISLEEAQEEADWLLQQIAGWEIDMPVVYDWEYMGAEERTGSMTARLLTDCTILFCEAVKAAGYEPMVYFNRHQAQDLLYLAELKQYPFWLAMYSDRMSYPYKVRMWQYTNQGKVPGIDTDVDINLWFPDRE